MLQHDSFKLLLEKEDLPVTRVVIRQHALRLCFCRTMIAVASSTDLQTQVHALLAEHRGKAPRQNSSTNLTYGQTTRAMTTSERQRVKAGEANEAKITRGERLSILQVPGRGSTGVALGVDATHTVSQQLLSSMEARMNQRMDRSMKVLEDKIATQHQELLATLKASSEGQQVRG
jgi:hypothetical protein